MCHFRDGEPLHTLPSLAAVSTPRVRFSSERLTCRMISWLATYSTELANHIGPPLAVDLAGLQQRSGQEPWSGVPCSRGSAPPLKGRPPDKPPSSTLYPSVRCPSFHQTATTPRGPAIPNFLSIHRVRYADWPTMSDSSRSTQELRSTCGSTIFRGAHDA